MSMLVLFHIMQYYYQNDDLSLLLYYLFVYLYSQEDGYTVRNFVLVCSGGPWFLWIPRFVVTYIYRLTVFGAGAVFAYLIRHVKINPLNDSRFMAVFITTAIVVSFVGNLSDLLLYKYIGINTFASAWSIYVFISAILLFSVLFIPKVLLVDTSLN